MEPHFPFSKRKQYTVYRSYLRCGIAFMCVNRQALTAHTEVTEFKIEPL